MNQRTHAWIAIRAVALLEDEGDCPGLVKLLKPVVKAADIGAWIPDLQDAKLGGADIDNHILKMEPYSGPQKDRFTVPKKELLKKLGKGRQMAAFIKKHSTLPDTWWNAAYKANTPPGQHLADRAGALTTTIVDLLIMGDKKVAALVPDKFTFPSKLHPNCRTPREQAALYFFMQSHFVADACMPCHCDARKLSAYAKGLHKELEKHWSKKVGTYFDKKKLEKTSDGPKKVLTRARKVDAEFGITFTNKVPTLPKKRDIWKDTIYVCRGSFAVACEIAPPSRYKYTSAKKAPFKKVFAGPAGQELLGRVDAVAMHDAVLNVAIAWKHIWRRFG